MCSCCQSLAAKNMFFNHYSSTYTWWIGIHLKKQIFAIPETCSSPEKAAELGADTVLLPLEESGRVGGDPGGACTRCPPPPFTGVPSQSRFRRMEGLQQEESDCFCGWDLAKWLERLAVNAKVATVLCSIPASSGIWVAADEAVLNNVH